MLRQVRFLRANMNEWILNIHLRWCILMYFVCFLKRAFDWRWEIICVFHFIIIPQSSFSSTIVRTEAHTTGKFTACEYEFIHKSKYFHAMMHPIMFCMIQDDAFDWLWEILCLFHFISFLIVIFIYDSNETHDETGAFSSCRYEWMNSKYSPAMVHFMMFLIIQGARLLLIMKKNMLYWFRRFHDNRDTCWDRYVVCVRIWMNELSILKRYEAFYQFTCDSRWCLWL